MQATISRQAVEQITLELLLTVARDKAHALPDPLTARAIVTAAWDKIWGKNSIDETTILDIIVTEIVTALPWASDLGFDPMAGAPKSVTAIRVPTDVSRETLH